MPLVTPHQAMRHAHQGNAFTGHVHVQTVTIETPAVIQGWWNGGCTFSPCFSAFSELQESSLKGIAPSSTLAMQPHAVQQWFAHTARTQDGGSRKCAANPQPPHTDAVLSKDPPPKKTSGSSMQ